MTRGERGGNFRGKGEGFVGTIIKDTWRITGEGSGNGREVWRAGGWAEVEGKGRDLYLDNNKI